MLFRMRDASGATFWAGGKLRRTNGVTRIFQPADVTFMPGRIWRSPRTGTNYPVEWQLRADDIRITLEPLMDDQEYDARDSTGTIYWEGAVRVLRNGMAAGRGYLELTGYWRRLDL
jgi:predicted secreted hydrolase